MANLALRNYATKTIISIILLQPVTVMAAEPASSATSVPAEVEKGKKNKPEPTTPIKKQPTAEEKSTPQITSETTPRSAFSQTLADRLSLSTSVGFATVKKKSQDWRANGVADISLVLNTPWHLGSAAPLAVIARYSPFEVSPTSKGTIAQNEFRGVLHVVSIGAGIKIPITPTMEIMPTFEAAIMRPKLIAILPVPDAPIPNQQGTGLIVGVLTHWKLREGFYLGPKINFGMGTFTTTQLSASASFIF